MSNVQTQSSDTEKDLRYSNANERNRKDFIISGQGAEEEIRWCGKRFPFRFM